MSKFLQSHSGSLRFLQLRHLQFDSSLTDAIYEPPLDNGNRKCVPFK